MILATPEGSCMDIREDSEGFIRDTSNFGIGNSICKHGLKLCVSLLDYLGGAMIHLCGSLLDLWISTYQSCVALLQFLRPVFFCTNE